MSLHPSLTPLPIWANIKRILNLLNQERPARIARPNCVLPGVTLPSQQQIPPTASLMTPKKCLICPPLLYNPKSVSSQSREQWHGPVTRVLGAELTVGSTAPTQLK